MATPMMIQQSSDAMMSPMSSEARKNIGKLRKVKRKKRLLLLPFLLSVRRSCELLPIS
jgi:hypothetical protein